VSKQSAIIKKVKMLQQYIFYTSLTFK